MYLTADVGFSNRQLVMTMKFKTRRALDTEVLLFLVDIFAAHRNNQNRCHHKHFLAQNCQNASLQHHCKLTVLPRLSSSCGDDRLAAGTVRKEGTGNGREGKREERRESGKWSKGEAAATTLIGPQVSLGLAAGCTRNCMESFLNELQEQWLAVCAHFHIHSDYVQIVAMIESALLCAV